MPTSPPQDFSPHQHVSPHDWQRLLDAVPVPLFVKNAQGKVLFLNQAWHHQLGLKDDPLTPHAEAPFFTPEQMARFAAQDRAAFALGHPVANEDLVFQPDSEPYRHMQTTLAPLFDAQGAPQFLVGTTQDHTEQWRLEQQDRSERTLLEMLASQARLPDIMHRFILDFEATFHGALCSVLLVDEDGIHLRHGAAPSLPPAYCQALDGTTVGSCSTAACTGKDVLVADIANDALWKDHRDLALQHGLRACWSTPIRSAQGQPLGAFCNYYRHVRAPSATELQAIQRGAYLLGLSIERDRAAQRMQANQRALEDAGLYRQAILDSMVDGLLTVNRQGRILSYNNAACSMLGMGADLDQCSQLSELFTTTLNTRADGSLDWLLQVDAQAGQGKTVETFANRRGGPSFPVSVSLSRMPHTSEHHYVVLLRDITQQRQDEEEIRRLAFYDPLTGLPNRRLLLERVRQAVAHSALLEQHGSLMFLDLDHFKLLNDTLGHDVGDELLQLVARRLRSCVRDGDSVARLGGDEFVVLLEGLSTHASEAAAQAEAVARKILETLAAPYELRQYHFNSTPSIGVVLFLQNHDSIDELFKKADVAMYQAKTAGRNTMRFFDPVMQAAAANEAELTKEIRLGIQRQEFVLYYQMQMDIRGQCLGAEALVRWLHPTRSVVTPGQFIPLAEETGMILPLGQWVLETACAQLVTWGQDPQTAHWTLSVNVSASQMAQAEFVSNVREALRKSGAPAHRLKLEITESMLVNDMEDIVQKMNAIQQFGVSFSLDDFGTGYSSLSYLKRLPLSQLKIDQSFVRDVLTDPSDAMIARTVVALGRNLGLMVIAEGVETRAQRDALAEMGCDAFQGYFFDHPAPAQSIGEKTVQTR